MAYGSCAGPTPCAAGDTCGPYDDCTETCCDSGYCNGRALGVVSAAFSLTPPLVLLLLWAL